MTRSWTDEQISAFLDGELPAADMDTLGRDVEADAVLAARVEKLGAATKAFVAVAAEIDRQPMSPAVAKILAGPLKASALPQQPGAKVLAFRPRTTMGVVSAWVMEHRALAAALLCAAMVGGIASGLRGESDAFAPQVDGVIAANSSLHRALENGMSGETVRIAANVAVIPRLTFATDTAASDGGVFCRQFDVASVKGVTSAIACREGGAWRTEVAVFNKSGFGKGGMSSDYQAAGGGKAPALEAFMDTHMSGPAFDRQAETKAISDGWRR